MHSSDAGNTSWCSWDTSMDRNPGWLTDSVEKFRAAGDERPGIGRPCSRDRDERQLGPQSDYTSRRRRSTTMKSESGQKIASADLILSIPGLGHSINPTPKDRSTALGAHKGALFWGDQQNATRSCRQAKTFPAFFRAESGRSISGCRGQSYMRPTTLDRAVKCRESQPVLTQ
jgi:hypothetical protein